MKSVSRLITRGLFPALVAAGLSFGAWQAMAGPATLPCDQPPYYGYCSTQEQCQAICDDIFGENNRTGDCKPWGCCACWI